MGTSNADISKLLREIAAAYSIKKSGNVFEIRAYENAADSIEHLTSEAKDLWVEGKLDEIPGLGKSLRAYLGEFFKTGKIKHFEVVKKGIPGIVFELLDVPGVGPKTAQEIAKLGVRSFDGLVSQIKSGELVKKGFSGKIAEKILGGLEELGEREGRMLLPYATAQADRILQYLKKCLYVIDAHPLGSLRRQVATVGDLDFSASSKSPEKVVNYFCKMPGIDRIVEKGESSATVILQSGLQLDLLVGSPETYGALLQHFTGSKAHNIKLRTLAEKKGLSLSEHGVRKLENGKLIIDNGELIETKTEEAFYKILGMDTPPPEIRENTGEIEVALKHDLPNLIKLEVIKGDLHTHSNYPFPNPSHGPGADLIEEIVKKAQELKYEFIGISDHAPGHGKLSKAEMIKAIEKRTNVIQLIKKKTKSIRVLNGLEIDILPDGSLSVPNEALTSLDYCIAGIHSDHRGGKEVITRRLLNALSNPNVDIISHPTNRLLNERDSSEADWETIFKFAAINNKILEIDSYPNRLDLRDDLVRLALGFGVRFVIDSDAHAIEQMDNMPFGVSVARRGWTEKKDIVNTWGWTKFAKWFKMV
ncbi:hypothetical protein A3F00_04115 [Candidatus Daviesbacteria bacterium RIFCSPHIGHO2_12_FULL_37_11]|uniref:DNA-directed DNA polymerase n=1 Tax=Candidatus Daviesbacteria bacterium RIFCSPHIGHO2_12_FULL_37_11 TaxID=1797777 RepID=A0A1F5KEG3_9BACT|nr:MAG: hypothetical protein A2111_00655 [Candidatus Daviesbacteria bacterium GWA1_38_6]OGE18146.1 MAG: hypothetical protein A2769_02780 [Candidatus Daviesbacteria bacterium RIFCSPHIGHO2_01_FULL_37_27]OGE39244.1 MAG: hypothetical protein A3F00_04115 [Candidatus Daviesbacteria bacterium RIFCSPHIGHO2_12_FULL_37_11]OGE45638.1 MAG: hypothetical protein A3B39_00605 [Candidatus Daviesbacteria bacterium RIFCSPLOWO2_01_FULL_37_10]